jgi:hypothetical protein
MASESVKGLQSSRRAPAKKQQHGLPEAELDIQSLRKDELEVCGAYEYPREAAIGSRPKNQQCSRLECEISKLRSAEAITDFDSGLSSQTFLYCAQSFAVPVIYREWPARPYQKIDARERRRRIALLRFRQLTDEEKVKFLLTQRSGDIQIPLSIPKGLPRKEYANLLDGLLNLLSPKRAKTKPQGHRASPEFYRDQLYALAAFRLQERGGLSRSEIIEVLKDGRAKRYNSVQALSVPLRKVRKRLSSYAAVMAGVYETFRNQLPDVGKAIEEILAAARRLADSSE